MDEEKKIRFDALAVLWKRAWESRDDRKKYEWRAAFGLWLALGFVSINLLTNASFKFDEDYTCGLIIILILILGIHIYWITGILKTNKADMDIARHYEDKMRELSDSKFNEEFYTKLKKLSPHWSYVSQLTITIIICVFTFYAFVSGK